jgi:predicted flap endonuclease-1-like 5' DNA nuclease
LEGERRAAWAALALAVLLLAHALPCAPGSPRPHAAAPARGAARLLWGLPLDLNREAARDLEALPGIGPGRARAIVTGRPYCTFADLDRVSGIGPATLSRLRALVVVPAALACGAPRGD